MRAFAQAPSAESTTRGNGSTFSLGVLAAMLACALAFLGIGAPAAGAAPSAGLGWKFRVSFAPPDEVAQGAVRNSVAVDSSGNIVLANFGQSRAEIFAPDPLTGGNFLVDVPVPLASVRNLAVDPSDDTLYVDGFALFGDTTIRRLLSDGQPTPTYTVDPGFEVPAGEGFAVDTSTGDLLVTDPGAEAVQRYDTSGALVETIATPGIAPVFIASRPDGSFYVASEAGPDIVHLSGSGAVLDTIAGAGALRGLTWEGADQVLVASTGATLKTYSSAAELKSESLAQTEAGTGLAFDPVLELLYQRSPGAVYVYEPATIPGVEPPVVSAIAGHSAHLSAEVDPGEGPPAESVAHFEYSDDGGVSWDSTPDVSVERTVTDEPDTIEADLTGLLANQEYLVRVKASNAGATKTSSAVSFTTAQIAPEVEATGASGVEESSAVLNGSINPNGLQTTYYFEYGTTESYGSRVPLLVDGVAGNERVSRSFSEAVSGLAPSTTYHYRLVAENAIGQIESADKTFATAGSGELAPQRAYEMVTPLNKGGAQVLSDFHLQVSDQGSAVAVSTVSGAQDSESVMMRQNFVNRRGDGGWEDWEPTDPPQESTPGVWESSTQAVSEDYKHAMVASNRVLAPGAVAGDGNLYIKDLQTGTYTFVGNAPDGYGSLVGPAAASAVFAAGAPDFSWVLFWSRVPMIDGVTGRALYRWSKEGGLSLESRTPSNGIPPAPLKVLPDSTPRLPASSADGTLTAFDPEPYFVFFPTFEVGGGVYIRQDGQTTPIAISRLEGAGDANDASSTLNWVTPSGRYVFFQSPTRLTEEAPENSGTADKVYRYDTDTDELIYVGLKIGRFSFGFLGASDDGQTVYLSQDDGGTSETTVWHEGATRTVTSERVGGYVTPNGRYFAWLGSAGRAYLYDFESDEKVCVSCAADGGAGSPAHFGIGSRNMGNQVVRAVTEGGTMFFDTKSALLPSDHNGSKDVYAYKNGHLTLISPGDGEFDAFFVGTSADGADVYFQTDQGLVPKDNDRNSDVYDARIGGGFAETPPGRECSGEGCRNSAGGSSQNPRVGSAADRAEGPGAVIRRVKALSRAQRETLARGGKVRLQLRVGKAGTVSVTGKAKGRSVIKSSTKAKAPGMVSVPLRLSKAGLSELGDAGSLNVRLAIAFDGNNEKTMNLALKRAAGKKKGGRS